MDIGMLWFDDSARPLEEKLGRAVDYYQEKYGETPTLCLINPDTLQKHGQNGCSMEIRGATLVMPDHFWVGIGKDQRN